MISVWRLDVLTNANKAKSEQLFFKGKLFYKVSKSKVGLLDDIFGQIIPSSMSCGISQILDIK